VKKLGTFAVKHRFVVLLVWMALAVTMGALSNSFGSAYADSFSLPGTDSVKAMNIIGETFGAALKGDRDQIVYQAASTGAFARPAIHHAIEQSLHTIATLPGVASVTSPYPCDGPVDPNHALGGFHCAGSFQHQMGRHGVAYAVVTFATSGFKVPLTEINAVMAAGATAASRAVHVSFGGNAFGQGNQKKGSPGEIFGFLAAAIVLLLAFGSAYAMFLPIGVAVFSLFIASCASALLSHGISIASFAPILGSLIGAGVGIDYALFIVTRTRQGVKQGVAPRDAVVTAINTSGRAVIFAGLTVCIALLGMLVLRLGYLNGVAISASVTVLITMVAAVTLLPALLGVLGVRVLSRRERRVLATEGHIDEATSGAWARWSAYVARKPRRLAIGALAVIVVLCIPFFSLQLGSADQGTDPSGSTTRVAYDTLSAGFGAGFNTPLSVVVQTTPAQADASATAVGHALSALPAVAAVAPLSRPVVRNGVVTYVASVVSKYSSQDPRTQQLIDTIRRDVRPVARGQLHVGGLTAIFADFATVISGKMPLFLGVIVLLGCLLLMVAFRSLLVPVTAALMNLLAAGASFGVVVAVFQWGWGTSLIGSGSGPVESFLPVIMIAILFGLSMDYQVFLVSRMHEEWVHTGDNQAAITRGQASTGRVITAAALIMICVFVSFVFGGQRVIAEFGIGLGGAVLLDAFILRTVLVPAIMHLAGSANWWIPRGLDRVLPRVAIEIDEA
jgi:putative drug exporter of the RND superfamily